MKLTENKQYVTVAEYRSCITLLRAHQNAFYGCCNNAERQGWRKRALNQLSKAKLVHCHWANTSDVQRFESASLQLQQRINSVSPEGLLINIT
ncbi:TPA: hypothetical protein O8U02_003560 [Enterobacter kobei]|nr:hypothetical protein [Enterobacter kobei]